MPTSLERLQDDVALLAKSVAEHDTWMKVHDVSCAGRYRELRDSLLRQNRVIYVGFILLGIVAIGLKTKFGEALLKLLDLV